ncbi:MAG: Gfo/Idh/MocA family oxidoreductase [Magnetococcales bacterium]|nr:Gfo/Idh/MocA family oxidoreductase [Magnetococcales bacterium]
MSDASLKVGLVGFGYWGPNMARNLHVSTKCHLAGICDSDPDKLKKAARFFPNVPMYENYDDMLKDKNVEAIVITTPLASHFELASAALKSGRHILVTKPFTQTSDQAQQLIELAKKRNLTLMLDHTFIYTGAVKKLKSLIDEDELGKIHYYDSKRINLGLFQQDTNVMWDLAIHDFAILQYLIKESPVGICAVSSNHFHGANDNMAVITLFYDSGIFAHVNVNWLSPVKIRHTLIGGQKKMVVYNDLESSEKLKIYNHGVDVSRNLNKDLIFDYRIGDMCSPQLDSMEAILAEVDHFSDCVSNNTAPQTTGESGLTLIRWLEAADKSSKNGSVILPLAKQE